MTWDVTRWIAANKDAAEFLAGQFDPWGMHVNTYYLGMKYPIDAFAAQDSYPVIAHQYTPVFPLTRSPRTWCENWQPGTDWEKDQTLATSPGPDPDSRRPGPVRDPRRGRRGRVPVPGRRDSQRGRHVRDADQRRDGRRASSS